MGEGVGAVGAETLQYVRQITSHRVDPVPGSEREPRWCPWSMVTVSEGYMATDRRCPAGCVGSDIVEVLVTWLHPH